MQAINQGLMQDFQLTIPTLLEHAATNHGNTKLVARQHDGSIFRYTYSELANRSRQAANALLLLGVKCGDVVSKIATWWTPDDVIVIDEMPMTATGKIRKLNLREEYCNHLVKTGFRCN
jgi:acyl-CoA synthetase (AMP-forming)/AMP-acid ligase II